MDLLETTLKIELKRRGSITPAKLAAGAGIPLATARQFFDDARDVRLSVLEKICCFLSMTLIRTKDFSEHQLNPVDPDFDQE